MATTLDSEPTYYAKRKVRVHHDDLEVTLLLERIRRADLLTEEVSAAVTSVPINALAAKVAAAISKDAGSHKERSLYVYPARPMGYARSALPRTRLSDAPPSIPAGGANSRCTPCFGSWRAIPRCWRCWHYNGQSRRASNAGASCCDARPPSPSVR